MAYTPREFYKDGEYRIAETAAEDVELSFAGWLVVVNGQVMQPDPETIDASMADVNNALEAAKNYTDQYVDTGGLPGITQVELDAVVQAERQRDATLYQPKGSTGTPGALGIRVDAELPDTLILGSPSDPQATGFYVDPEAPDVLIISTGV